jgi:hypothetical protein
LLAYQIDASQGYIFLQALSSTLYIFGNGRAALLTEGIASQALKRGSQAVVCVSFPTSAPQRDADVENPGQDKHQKKQNWQGVSWEAN